MDLASLSVYPLNPAFEDGHFGGWNQPGIFRKRALYHRDDLCNAVAVLSDSAVVKMAPGEDNAGRNLSISTLPTKGVDLLQLLGGQLSDDGWPRLLAVLDGRQVSSN